MINSSLEYLKGVYPIRAALLNEELGLKTINDLIYFFLLDTLIGQIS